LREKGPSQEVPPKRPTIEPTDEEHVMAQGSTLFEAATEYWRDAAQRGVLFMETLNERGNTYVAQSAKTAPQVLNFPVEILRDGRALERPANYALVRIVPPTMSRLTPLSRRSLSSTRARDMVPTSAASSRKARSASPYAPAIPCTSSAFCRSLNPDRRSRMSATPMARSSRTSPSASREWRQHVCD
jgi:Protein of unknown function (DUF3141)